jgi:hypothetical protein
MKTEVTIVNEQSSSQRMSVRGNESPFTRITEKCSDTHRLHSRGLLRLWYCGDRIRRPTTCARQENDFDHGRGVRCHVCSITCAATERCIPCL